MPLHTITYHYIPLHTITYHYIPLHTITYHYIPLHTITYYYVPTYLRTYVHTYVHLHAHLLLLSTYIHNVCAMFIFVFPTWWLDDDPQWWYFLKGWNHQTDGPQWGFSSGTTPLHQGWPSTLGIIVVVGAKELVAGNIYWNHGCLIMLLVNHPWHLLQVFPTFLESLQLRTTEYFLIIDIGRAFVSDLPMGSHWLPAASPQING